jgi:DNA repair exonuclease SbcCD ATPase subunit
MASLNMDYLKENPLREVAQSDQVTKLQFANVMSRALLNREAVDPAKINDLRKGELKYAGTGIHRKLDLCEELRKKSEKLDALLREKDQLHIDIGTKAATIVLKPIVLEEYKLHSNQRRELNDRVLRLVALNQKQTNANKLMNEEINHLLQQVKSESDNSGSLAKGVLAKIQRQFDKQNNAIESEIANLESRKEELLEGLSSQTALPLHFLLESGHEGQKELRLQKIREAIDQKKKAYFEYKDLVDASHAKVSLQVRRSRDEIEHKWKVEVEFLKRRIEDRRSHIRQLDSELANLAAELKHRHSRLIEADTRLSNLKGALEGNYRQKAEENGRNDPAKVKKFEIFVDYLSEVFSKMRSELDGLWNINSHSHASPQNEQNLRVFAEYVSEITENLDNCRL